jgi:hypothetical protein
LDAETTAYFADIVELVQASFDNVSYTIDSTPQRSILRLEATYVSYRVLITELFNERVRKYRYYLLKGNYVEVGFDNSPDPRTLRLKYGNISRIHAGAGEFIPHLHLKDKSELVLTEEMTVPQFVDWLLENI